MRKRKYKIGDVFNNREIIGYVQSNYYLRCLDCGKETRQGSKEMRMNFCICYNDCVTFTTKPLNKKLSRIRDKYKNGVTIEHLKEWIGD